MFSAASGAVTKQGRNLPAPAAILSTIFEGVQLPFDQRRFPWSPSISPSC